MCHAKHLLMATVLTQTSQHWLSYPCRLIPIHAENVKRRILSETEESPQDFLKCLDEIRIVPCSSKLGSLYRQRQTITPSSCVLPALHVYDTKGYKELHRGHPRKTTPPLTAAHHLFHHLLHLLVVFHKPIHVLHACTRTRSNALTAAGIE